MTGEANTAGPYKKAPVESELGKVVLGEHKEVQDVV